MAKENSDSASSIFSSASFKLNMLTCSKQGNSFQAQGKKLTSYANFPRGDVNAEIADVNQSLLF